jgi:hypothetical protein
MAATFVVLAYVATATLVASMPLPAALRAAAVVAIGAYSLWTLRSAALHLTRTAIVGIEITADGRVALIERGGARREGSIRPASYVGTLLTTLVVRVDDARWSSSLAILPDMLSADEMRRLRVLLRVVGSTRATSEGARATPLHR